MKNEMRLYSKLGLVLVIISFFMPISCNQNGFQLAEYMVRLGDMGSSASIGGAGTFVRHPGPTAFSME
jgi:hypothetical protein